MCQFLAQKPIPVQRVEEVTSTAVELDVDRAAPIFVVADVPSDHHSRAPPCVA